MSERTTYTLSDLLYLMRRLRDPDIGCPWDIKQNWQSITSSTIEEAYEVVEAIDSEDKDKIKEELGDLLFQVVFYSELATEESEFDFNQVVDTLTCKLIARHPHVFPDGQLLSKRDKNQIADERSINLSWEAIKKREREGRGQEKLLADIPVNLPAMSRAEKLQKRVSRVGLDWDNVDQLFDKIQEEIAELSEALQSTDNRAAIENELGDLFFTCVNLARFLGVDGEKALRGANRKFEKRVSWIEKRLDEHGRGIEDCNAIDLDSYWEQAKKSGL